MSRPKIPSISANLKEDLYLSLRLILKNIQPEESPELSIKLNNDGYQGHYQLLIDGINDSKITGQTTTIPRKKLAGKLAEAFSEIFDRNFDAHKMQRKIPAFGKVANNKKISIEYDSCNFKNKKSLEIVFNREFFDQDQQILPKIAKAFSIATSPKTKAKNANAGKLQTIEETRSI